MDERERKFLFKCITDWYLNGQYPKVEVIDHRGYTGGGEMTVRISYGSAYPLINDHYYWSSTSGNYND